MEIITTGGGAVQVADIRGMVPGFLRAQISLNTQTTYGRAIQRYLVWCDEQGIDPSRITLEQASAYRDNVSAEFADSSAALHISAVKSLYKMARDLDVPVVNVWAVVKAPKAPTTSQTRPLDPQQLRAVYKQAEKTSERDLLIIQLLYECALRRDEVASLPKSALEHTADGWALRIKGKGGKEIKVGIKEDIAHRILHFAGQSEGPWLIPGRAAGTHLDKRQINNIIQRYGVHPHQFRHTFVTQALRGGESLQNVARSVRHENVQTTMRYYDESLRVSQSSLRAVASPLDE